VPPFFVDLTVLENNEKYENERNLQHWHFPPEFFSNRCEEFGHVKNSDGLGSYFRESFSSCPPL
jgi:hypothetical protein